MSDKVKLILKGRTQMVERTYKYFNLDLSESHRVKLYICTPLDPRFKKFNMCQHTSTLRSHSSTQSVHSCVRLYDMKTDKLSSRLQNFKTSPDEEDDVKMTGEGEDSGTSSRDEDDFEKQMCLEVNLP